MLESARDQATGLREMFEPPPGLAVLPMAATRRGVGLHSLVTNIAAAVARQGPRAIVIDADAKGVADVLGLRMPHDLADLLSGERSIHDVAVQTAEGYSVLNARKGLPEFVQMSGDAAQLFAGFRRLDTPFDFAILAGPAHEIAAMTRDRDDLIMVTSPEGDALTATYAEIKRAHADHAQTAFRVVVNRADDEREGAAAFKRLADAARRFLGISVEYGGSITRDAAFVAADRAQRSVFSVAAASDAARQISQLTQSMQAWRLGRYGPDDAANEH